MKSHPQTIREILGSDVIEITPILGKGSVNKVFKVRQSSGTVIVRLNSADKFPKFQKEAWALDEAQKIGIPSPKVLDLGVKNHHSFMIQSFVEGLNGKEIIDDKTDIWFRIGQHARLVHSIKTIGFGERMASAGLFDDTWLRYLNYNIDSLKPDDQLISRGVITIEQSEKLKKLFQELLKKPFKFGMNHGDLSLANVIVLKNGQVTLIDWGESESSIVPYVDFIGILQNHLKEASPLFEWFLKGYGLTKDEYLKIKPDLEAIRLLKAVDLLRWAIDKKPGKINQFSKRLRKLVNQ